LLYLAEGHLPRPRPYGDRGLRILEIGGGYGALASALLATFPRCEYCICDLPESLLFSGLYLAMTREDGIALRQVGDANGLMAPRVNLTPNYLFDRLDGHFDLVINTLSMSEMSNHQIEHYARDISKLIGSTGIFFEQNQDNRHMPRLTYSKPILEPHFAKRTTL
jgi:putative sugar O-methyltransferase